MDGIPVLVPIEVVYSFPLMLISILSLGAWTF